MNAEFLDCQLAAYLSLRETLGFQITADKRLLTEFVEFVLAQGLTGPIRVQLTLDWACSSSAQHGATGCARRLSVARRFLLFVRASAPQTEIPGPGLLPSPKRPKPYIFTSAQIAQLVATARDSRPRHLASPAHVIDVDWLVGQHWATRRRGDSLAGHRCQTRSGPTTAACATDGSFVNRGSCRCTRVPPISCGTMPNSALKGTTTACQTLFSCLNKAGRWIMPTSNTGFYACVAVSGCYQRMVAAAPV